jgi:hypothetical protein
VNELKDKEKNDNVKIIFAFIEFEFQKNSKMGQSQKVVAVARFLKRKNDSNSYKEKYSYTLYADRLHVF